MFEPVASRVSFPDLEEGILAFWHDHDIFKRSVDERPADKIFSFYEGPPTANGNPGIHHVLARVFKDLIPRYQTMRGYRVPRKGGWDTHGLPVELEVEKQLGLRSKPDIEVYGIEEFNRQCRESVFRYVEQWERMTERIGFWVDTEHAYVTYSREYVETCWWIFKRLWDNGLMFRDYRVTPHCPRCETSLSSHEIALGYKEDTPDPSVTVRFRLLPETNLEAPAAPVVEAVLHTASEGAPPTSPRPSRTVNASRELCGVHHGQLRTRRIARLVP
jgi:isoleucyl-tRNA synthetase